MVTASLSTMVLCNPPFSATRVFVLIPAPSFSHSRAIAALCSPEASSFYDSDQVTYHIMKLSVDGGTLATKRSTRPFYIRQVSPSNVRVHFALLLILAVH